MPIAELPPSQRRFGRFGMVFAVRYDDRGPFLRFLAFGERHPDLVDTRSVYERAHKRVHGRYPGH